MAAALAAPTSLTATVVSDTVINLTWVDNSGSNESGFRIERSSGGSPFAEIGTVGPNVTSYVSTGLTASTIYTYRVRAYNGSSQSGYSNEATATTRAAVPAAPTNLVATVLSSSRLG